MIITFFNYAPEPESIDPPDEVAKQVFPWIEQEQRALLEREQENHFARDIALRQYLTTMVWLRRVLIQDAAVLFTQNLLAVIFTHGPFRSQSFRDFAAASTAAIDAAKETARLAFQNLPQHLVASMQGLLATQQLSFERERQNYQAEMLALRGQMGKMGALLEVVAGSKRVKTAHGMFIVLSRIFCLTRLIVLPPYAPLTVVPDPGGLSLAQFSPETPSVPVSSSSNISFDPSSSDFPATEEMWMAATLLEPWSYDFDLPSQEVQLPQPAVFDSPVAPVFASPSPSTPLAASGSPEERQQYYFQRFGEARFRKHAPEWIDGDWLPRYTYASVAAIWDIWVEWDEGVSGFISVRDLNATWGCQMAPQQLNSPK